MLCTFYTRCTYAVYLLYALYVRCVPFFYLLGYDLYVPSERTVSNEGTTICCFGQKVVRLFYIVHSFVNIT